MSNSNLKTFDNFYADLAQSAYTGRPIKFPYVSLSEKNRTKIDSGKSIPFDFSKNTTYSQLIKDPKTGKEIKIVQEVIGGGQDLSHGGKVYLQPDPSLHTEAVTMDIQVPSANGGYHTETQISEYYQKGLMTDEKAGFNSYFLTDTPTLGKDTTKTYMAIRGSDGL